DRGLPPADRVDHGVGILEREITMPGRVPLPARDLAPHPDVREALLDRALQRKAELGDGEFGKVRPSRLLRSGRRSACHGPHHTRAAAEAATLPPQSAAVPERIRRARKKRSLPPTGPVERVWWPLCVSFSSDPAGANMRSPGRSPPLRYATSSSARPGTRASR